MSAQRAFLDVLLAGAERRLDEAELAALTERFRQALVDIADTEDNKAAAALVTLRRGEGAQGLALEDGGPALGDLFWTMEGEAIPPSVAERFPELSQEQWDAACRVLVQVLSALQGEPG